jgi:membrane protease subunit HflK
LASRDEEELGNDDRIRRSVARTLANWATGLVSLAVILGWASTSVYTLEPGESAVILRLGERNRVVAEEGLHWHLPNPIEHKAIVNVSAVRQREFGLQRKAPADPRRQQPADDATPSRGDTTTSFENAMQTADNNIVNLGYVLKYRIADPFTYLYGVAEPEETLFDAARAAVREVVGQMSVDDVLYTRQSDIRVRAREVLEARLTAYFEGLGSGSPFQIQEVELQIVQAPAQVQEAFDEIIAAGQDEERAISEARGDAKETLERAQAVAIELEQGSIAYKQSRVLEARGRAVRFEALLAEYRLAPEVTRRRLYLETMEEVLPLVDKMVIEPGAASVVPLIPMSVGGAAGARPAGGVPPVAAPGPSQAPLSQAPSSSQAGRAPVSAAPEPAP